MNSGIYKIVNKIDGKIYVGQSIHLEKRKNEHFKELINNKHQNQHLQYAFNKYGINNFDFIVFINTKCCTIHWCVIFFVYF